MLIAFEKMLMFVAKPYFPINLSINLSIYTVKVAVSKLYKNVTKGSWLDFPVLVVGLVEEL